MWSFKPKRTRARRDLSLWLLAVGWIGVCVESLGAVTPSRAQQLPPADREEIADQERLSWTLQKFPPQPYMNEIYWQYSKDTPAFFRDSLVQFVARTYLFSRDNFDGSKSLGTCDHEASDHQGFILVLPGSSGCSPLRGPHFSAVLSRPIRSTSARMATGPAAGSIQIKHDCSSSCAPHYSGHQRFPCFSASSPPANSVIRNTSKITAVDQPNNSTPFIAVIGPSKCQRSTGVMSP
jgi:hypothetical protein